MRKRWTALLCCALLLFGGAARAEERLSDEELSRILWEMYQSENESAEFMVLPDDYEVPAVGVTGIYNLLLVGVDNPGDKLTGRSDTMLLASLNAHTGELKLVSFMRDLYVAIPHSGHDKLNASYSYGGAPLLLETLEQCFGVHIDGYVTVNYALMVDLVDAIGGVELTVTEAERKKLNGILEYYNYLRGNPEKEGRLEESGLLRLTGLQTMSFARIRKLDSDFVRVQRQQRVIMAIYEQLTTLSLPELMRIAGENITRVETNVTLAQAASLLSSAMGLDTADFSTLRIPVDGGYRSETLNGTYYIVPRLEYCREKLREFLYGNE